MYDILGNLKTKQYQIVSQNYKKSIRLFTDVFEMEVLPSKIVLLKNRTTKYRFLQRKLKPKGIEFRIQLDDIVIRQFEEDLDIKIDWADIIIPRKSKKHKLNGDYFSTKRTYKPKYKP